MPQVKSKDFFVARREWSEWKHQLLNMYLATASKIMGGIWERVVYVDGFAGRGTYGDGDALLPGSPLKAAELARDYATRGKTYSLQCINIEEDEECFADLCAVTAPFGDLVINCSGTFVENIDRIVREMRGRAAICFLDPFGIKGIDWSAVEQLIRRPNPTDLWIRFDHQTVRRLSGFFASGDPRGPKKLNNLLRVYGITDAEFLHEQLAGPTTEVRLEKALMLYMARLAQTYQKVRGDGHSAVYPIRTRDGQIKYHMVFATGHRKGMTVANDVVFTVEETYQKKVRNSQPHQLGLFDPSPEQIFVEIVQNLRQNIWESYKGRIASRSDIYIEMLHQDWFGRIKSTHLTKALKALQDENYIIQTTGATSKDETRFTFRS